MRYPFGNLGETSNTRSTTTPATTSTTPVRRSFALLSAAALTAGTLLVAGSADAAVTAGGGRNDDNTPAYVRDAQGLALQMCSDANFCEPAAAPDIGSYFTAEAALGPMRAIWGIDAAFLENAAGDITTIPGVTNSALFRADGLRPNRRYTIRGPWGTHRCFTDGRGRLDNKNCMFQRGGEAGGRLAGGPVKSLLRAVPAPRGFVGNAVVPQRVTGSPTGFNRVTLNGPGAHFRTNLFVVGGQLVDNMPMSQVSKTSLRMGNHRNHKAITRILRYRSIGTAPARPRFSKSGDNPGAFRVIRHCGSVAPGGVCRIRVIYRPGVHDKSARLTITDNTLARPRVVRLTGIAPR